MNKVGSINVNSNNENGGVEASPPASQRGGRWQCPRGAGSSLPAPAPVKGRLNAARKTNCNNFTKNGVIHTFHGCIRL